MNLVSVRQIVRLAALCAGATMCFPSVAADAPSPVEHLAGQQQRLAQLGDGLEGLDDIPMRQPAPPGGNTGAPATPGEQKFSGTVTLVGGTEGETTVAPGGPCPATFSLKPDPSGAYWDLNIRSDRSKPNASQLDGKWTVKAKGTGYFSSLDIPGYSQTVSIDVTGDKIAGTISTKNDRRGDLRPANSSSYSFEATRVKP